MALNATIDLTVKKPDFKSMKSEIRELTVAAQQAVMQFGEFSPEAVKAEHALAGLDRLVRCGTPLGGLGFHVSITFVLKGVRDWCAG